MTNIAHLGSPQVIRTHFGTHCTRILPFAIARGKPFHKKSIKQTIFAKKEGKQVQKVILLQVIQLYIRVTRFSQSFLLSFPAHPDVIISSFFGDKVWAFVSFCFGSRISHWRGITCVEGGDFSTAKFKQLSPSASHARQKSAWKWKDNILEKG